MLVGSWFLRASSCMHTHKRKNMCQSAKFIKWADWVCKNGSLTQDKINDFLWNYSKYWDESGYIFFYWRKKGQNKLYWFLLSNYTHVCETVSEVWERRKKTNLTYKFYLVSCITHLSFSHPTSHELQIWLSFVNGLCKIVCQHPWLFYCLSSNWWFAETHAKVWVYCTSFRVRQKGQIFAFYYRLPMTNWNLNTVTTFAD